MTGVTVMLNISVTPFRGGVTSSEDRDVEEAEYMEEWGEGSEEKEDEGEEERAEGAAQARKVKLSLTVSESSWV